MQKKPFSPASVAEKQSELRSLSKAQLDAQIDLIRNDFKNWAVQNFELTDEQIGFLEDLDSGVLKPFSVEIAATIEVGSPTIVLDPLPVSHGTTKVLRWAKKVNQE